MDKVAVTFKLPAFGHPVIEAHPAHSSSIIRSVNMEMWTDWNVNVCKEGWDGGKWDVESFQKLRNYRRKFLLFTFKLTPPPHIQVTSPTVLVIKISQYRKRKTSATQEKWLWHPYGCMAVGYVWRENKGRKKVRGFPRWGYKDIETKQGNSKHVNRRRDQRR